MYEIFCFIDILAIGGHDGGSDTKDVYELDESLHEWNRISTDMGYDRYAHAVSIVPMGNMFDYCRS